MLDEQKCLERQRDALQSRVKRLERAVDDAVKAYRMIVGPKADGWEDGDGNSIDETMEALVERAKKERGAK